MHNIGAGKPVKAVREGLQVPSARSQKYYLEYSGRMQTGQELFSSPLDEVQKVELSFRNLDRLQLFLFQICCIIILLLLL